MKISISINGVLRDILGRFQSTYEKYYENVKSDVITPNLMEYVHFKEEDDLLNFLYDEAPMEIFGQATEIESNVITHLMELYKSMPDEYTLRLVSDDFGKAKASTLWFLAKYGCCCDEIRFYSLSTIENLWKDTDMFITDDANIIKAKPKNKKVVIIDKPYTVDLDYDVKISSLKELDEFKNV